MSPRLWKATAIILVLLTILTTQFIQGFHSERTFGTTTKPTSPDSGTLLIVESYPNADVMVNFSISFAGVARGISNVYLLNGTQYILDNSHQNVNIKAQIQGRFTGTGGSGGFGYVELNSTGNPMGIATVNDFSKYNFTTQYLNSRTFGMNYVAVYVTNSSNFHIKAVAMTL